MRESRRGSSDIPEAARSSRILRSASACERCASVSTIGLTIIGGESIVEVVRTIDVAMLILSVYLRKTTRIVRRAERNRGFF